MTLSEFASRHGDVVKDALTWPDLAPMANGAALFYASLSGGSKPSAGRRILWAGHVLTAGISGDEIFILRSTAHGNSKVTLVSKSEIESGRAVFFETATIPEYDSRNMEPWNHWA